jgi:hypothetical protein
MEDLLGRKNVNFSVDSTSANSDECKQQRMTRGFDDTELWNLDHTIVKFILPRLKEFKKLSKGSYPSEVETEENWQEILEKIIVGLEYYLEKDRVTEISVNDENGRMFMIEEAFQLLIKHFVNLWL